MTYMVLKYWNLQSTTNHITENKVESYLTEKADIRKVKHG